MRTQVYFWFGVICTIVGFIYWITGVGKYYDQDFAFVIAMMFFVLDELNSIKSKLNEPRPPQQD